MTEFILPPSVVPNLADWTLLDFSGIQQSVLSGAIRTVSRGQRWQAHYQWANLIQKDRNCLSALMAAIRGKSNRMWLSDPTYKQQGSFPAPELLVNGGFKNDASNWTPSTATLLAYNRQLSFTMTGGGAVGMSQSVTLVAGNAYALRALLIDGATSAALSMGVLLADGGVNYTNLGFARGLITVATPGPAGGGTANQYPIYGTGAALASMMCQYASLRRCALVNNPTSATFYTSIPVDQLPIATAGLLRAGDRCEINGEMKTVTFDLNSDSSGQGTLFFEPALRKLAPNNAPVIIGEPLMRGILSADAMQVTRPGTYLFSDFDFTFIEG